MKDEILIEIGVVDVLAADEPSTLCAAKGGKRDIAINAILPLQLVAIGVVAQVGRGLPRVIARFPLGVRHEYLSPVEAGEHAKVEADAESDIWDMRDADILLGVGPPARQAEVMRIGEGSGIDHGHSID